MNNTQTKHTGKILHTSWGYDMTHNDYAVVISETDKTVLCQMIKGKNVSENMYGTGTSTPTSEYTGHKPFRLRIKGDYFKGSYPFCSSDNNKRIGYFSVWEGKPNYWNTND